MMMTTTITPSTAWELLAHYQGATAEAMGGGTLTSLVTHTILYGIAVLDMLGARMWNLRTVGLSTCIGLGVIRMLFGKRCNVDWWALVHHFVTGAGSVLAVYLDVYASEALTGTPEPLRSCQCGGPLTSLHRILPAITMGYAVLDLIEGLSLGPDFALHGVMTFLVMTFFCETNLPQIVMPFLLMEVSSVFLCFCKADFLSDTMSLVVQLLFALTFFIFRIVVTPYIWLRLMITMYQHRGDDVYQSCINDYVFPVSLGMGLLFHALNTFWFYKIVRKIRRKLRGTPKSKKASMQRNSSRHKGHPRPSHQERTATSQGDKENASAPANATAATVGTTLRHRKAKTVSDRQA